MKRSKSVILIGICAVLSAILFMTGCTDDTPREGQTILEPEITADYLTDKYVAQITRDGAEHIFGTIEISTAEDGSAALAIAAKEYVKDESQPNGFYIADRNLAYTYPLSSEMRATFLSGGTSIPKVILSPEEFVSAVEKDLEEYGTDNPAYQEGRLYDIYVMSDQVALILARYIP